MADSILRDKAKDFAKAVVILCRDMKLKHKESVLINQLLRSATSIGANLHEAQYAQSTNDFISKLEIALKEATETKYWLRLLNATEYLSDTEFNSIYTDCSELEKLLVAIVKSTKK